MSDAIDRILAENEEADDALRGVVAALVAEPGIVWAGIGFLEDGVLTLGPAAGTADDTRRTRVTVSFQDAPVGELVVDGTTDDAFLESVAALIAPYVLIGWDTGGESWEP